jgi:hypothetical protein
LIKFYSKPYNIYLTNLNEFECFHFNLIFSNNYLGDATGQRRPQKQHAAAAPNPQIRHYLEAF